MAEHPLKTYRAEKGITQAELAGELGVWPVTVSRWERRDRTPRPKEAKRISEKTGISVGDLIEAGLDQ
jgi:transcriptional regulator with XRE-family HTH domain